MIYDAPPAEAPLDQGDLIDDCPVALVRAEASSGSSALVDFALPRIIVVSQTCDLANHKAAFANVAEVFDAQYLVDQKLFKPADIKGPLRSGRVWGWYFLPAHAALGLGEMVVDLRRLHTVRMDILRALCKQGKRRGQVQPLYREHLAKHFADTFSRIGLPKPYETL